MEHSSFERFAELCDVKIDLYASDFSSLSAMDLFVVVEAALLTFPGADELPLSPREKGIESNIHFSNCEQLLRLFFFLVMCTDMEYIHFFIAITKISYN